MKFVTKQIHNLNRTVLLVVPTLVPLSWCLVFFWPAAHGQVMLLVHCALSAFSQRSLPGYWNTVDFYDFVRDDSCSQGQRISPFVCSSLCEFNIFYCPWGTFFEFYTNIITDSRMSWLDLKTQQFCSVRSQSNIHMNSNEFVPKDFCIIILVLFLLYPLNVFCSLCPITVIHLLPIFYDTIFMTCHKTSFLFIVVY